MQNIEPVSRALDFIEAHLQETITVADMAEAAACSLYHFCRIFNQTARHTPYDYLIRRRLTEAARELLTTDQKIIDIACAYQFNTPETFSRAFRRMFDLQPNQLRKQGQLGVWAGLPRLRREHLEHIAKGSYLTPELEEKGILRVAGVMRRIMGGLEGRAELWRWLASAMAPCPVPAEGDRLWGIAYYPNDWKTAGYWYMAGWEQPETEPPAPPLAIQTIPASKCARFIHKGPPHDLPLTLDYVFYTWLPQSGRRPAQPLVMECPPPEGRDCESAESFVYLPIQ